MLVELKHPDLSMRHQCELLNLNRSTLYYEPVAVDCKTLILMNLIDEEYTRHPFYGSRKMTVFLRELGHQVNRKRIQRLMRLMGLEAIYPKPNTSKPSCEHKVYPYLLKGLDIIRPNQVWATDITYIRLSNGFVYLVAILDWASRYVLAWRLSNSLDSSFCLDALDESLQCARPDIFNSDQGAQFTSEAFTTRLLNRKIKISMDSRGRALDNVFVERLWRSVKYEEVYLKDYQSVREAKEGLGRYFEFYNTERFHQALDYQTPEKIYYGQN